MASNPASGVGENLPVESTAEGKNPLDAIHAAALSDIGLRREENQDSLGTVENDHFRFFMVADGMGGVKGGAIASGLAVQVIKDAYQGASQIDQKTLVAAVHKANNRIFEEALTKPTFTGMGTTFVGLAFTGTDLIVTSVGDSRAYRVREGQVVQLTEDHTLVMELLRSGTISPEQAHNHPVSHMLTRSLGPAPEVDVDCFLAPEKPRPGDVYLLCSDGLYNLVGEAEIGEILTTQELEAAVGTLVDLANERGGTDNITVIAIELGDEYPLPAESDAAAEKNSHETFIPQESREEAVAMAMSASQAKPESKLAPESADQEEPVETAAEESGPQEIEQVPGREAPPAAETEAQPSKAEETQPAEADSMAAKRAAAAPSAQPIEPLEEAPPSETIIPRSRPRPAPAAASQPVQTPRPLAMVSSLNVYGISTLAAVLVAGFILGKVVVFGGREAAVSPPPQERSMSQPAPQSRAASGQPAALEPREEPASRAPLLIDTRPDTHFPEPHTFPGEGSSSQGLTPEQIARIRARQQSLTEKVRILDAKIDSFDKPFGGDVARILTDAEARIEKYQKELKEVNDKVVFATRRLAIWVQRRKQLKDNVPLQLAAQVALSSESVRQKNEAFKEVTANYIREAEILLLNPADQKQSQKVAELAAARKQRITQLEAEIRSAIDKEISDADQNVAEIALERDKVALSLQNAQRDVLYTKTLVSNDAAAKAKVRDDLRRERDGTRAELDSLLVLLPAAPTPVGRTDEYQLDPNAAG